MLIGLLRRLVFRTLQHNCLQLTAVLEIFHIMVTLRIDSDLASALSLQYQRLDEFWSSDCFCAKTASRIRPFECGIKLLLSRVLLNK